MVFCGNLAGMENTNQKGGNSQASQVSNGFDWKNKNLWLGVAAALVVVLLIIILTNKKNKDAEAPVENAEVVDTAATEQAEVAKPTRRSPSTKQTAPAVKKMTYAEALVKYKDFRLQFDTECRAVPNNVTYKDGTEIMIDNRSGANRNFVVGSLFTVAPYDFKIVKVSSNVLPYTYLVDCGDKQNVATILLQR